MSHERGPKSTTKATTVTVFCYIYTYISKCVLKKNLSYAFFLCRAKGKVVGQMIAMLYVCSRINIVRVYSEPQLLYIFLAGYRCV